MMKEALPSRIPEPDRTWLALAAYNRARHMEDARRITQAPMATRTVGPT